MKHNNLKREVFNMILKLEVSKGHLQWKISEIARFTKISRTLIYYHFGKDKEELLKQAWDYTLTVFFATKENEKYGIRKRMENVISEINKAPFLFVLFFLEKSSNSHIGDMIRKAEKDLFKVLSDQYPQYSENDIKKIYLLELGSVAYRPKNVSDISFLFPR